MYRVLASRRDFKTWTSSLCQILAVAGVYYVSAQVDYFTRPLRGPVSSLWVPAGVAVVCLLLLGHRIWPGITIGAFFSSVPDLSLVGSVLVALGNTLAPLCSYLLLRQFHFRMQLDRLRDALVLVFPGSFGAMLVSASVGTLALTATGVARPADLSHVWMVWWSSDALGVLSVTPFLLVIRNFRSTFEGYDWKRWLELVGLMVATFGVTLAATRLFGLLFLAFPIVIWAAWRFQLAGVTPSALLISGIAIDAAAHGYGIFVGRPLLANLAILQVFNSSVVLTGLLLSVLITEWRHSRADVEQTCQRLTAVVDRLQLAMLPEKDYFPSLKATSSHKRKPSSS